jgi:hypothetical protein
VDIPFVLNRTAPAGTGLPQAAPDTANPAVMDVQANPAAERDGKLPALRLLLAAAVWIAGAIIIRRRVRLRR